MDINLFSFPENLILNEQEKFNQWERRIAPVENYVKNYTFPIYSTSDGKNFELFGSSVGVLVFENKYICTASHLIERISKTTTDIVIGVNGKFESINLDTAYYIKNGDIDFDICLVELNGNPDNVNYLDQSEFYLNDSFETGYWQYLQGFPISKNKYYDIHDHKKQRITTAYLKTAVKIDQSLKHPFNNISENTHLFFSYEESVYRKEGGLDIETKKRQNIPSLRGFSGCGIWNISNNIDTPSIELAGIFIQLKSCIGTGTKAECILDIFV